MSGPDGRDAATDPHVADPHVTDVAAAVERHRPAVESVCRTRLRSRVQAQATADVVLSAAAATPAGDLPDPRRLGAWLVRRAERECVQRIRQGARQAGPEVVVAGRPGGADVLLARRALAMLAARQADARSLHQALVPDDGPAPAARAGRLRSLLPGTGGGLAAVLLPPAGALATVAALVLPGQLPDDPPAVPPAAAVPAVGDGPQISPVGDGPNAVGIDTVLDGLTAVDPGPSAPAPPAGTTTSVAQGRPAITISGPVGPQIRVDDEDPQDDDVTVGLDRLLEVGASIGEALEELGDALQDDRTR